MSNKTESKKKVTKKVETRPKKVTKKTSSTKKSKLKKEDKNHQWYIVNTYSGYENRVLTQLEARINANKLDKVITKLMVPTQDKIVISKGKKKTIQEKIFPGYVLIKMDLNDETWQVVRNTEGVVGFVGTKNKPTPVNPDELKSILAFTAIKQPTFQTSYSTGDAVKVLDGPFKDFVGSISEINQDKGQLKVLLSVFGRETPVVFDFLQVKKL